MHQRAPAQILILCQSPPDQEEGPLRGVELSWGPLESEPELRGGIEVPRQPEGGVGGDAPLARDDLVDAPRGYAHVDR